MGGRAVTENMSPAESVSVSVALVRLYRAAAICTGLGLVAGLYYRELTVARHFTGRTELAVVHTHLLALGTLFFLVVIPVEKEFVLSRSRAYGWFFWTYTLGLIWTVAMMTVIGTISVLGHPVTDAISGLAGLGHILLTIGFVFFFIALHKSLFHTVGSGWQRGQK